MHAIRMLSVALAAMVFVAGCGPAVPETPEVVPVKGTVTFDGQPLGKAVISFQPTASGRGASAISNDDGSFAPSSFSSGDGLVPGSYGITVTKYPSAAAGVGADMDSEDYTGEDTAADDPKNELPAKYETRDSSGLTVEVKSGEPVEGLKLELTK